MQSPSEYSSSSPRKESYQNSKKTSNQNEEINLKINKNELMLLISKLEDDDADSFKLTFDHKGLTIQNQYLNIKDLRIFALEKFSKEKQKGHQSNEEYQINSVHESKRSQNDFLEEDMKAYETYKSSDTSVENEDDKENNLEMTKEQKRELANFLKTKILKKSKLFKKIKEESDLDIDKIDSLLNEFDYDSIYENREALGIIFSILKFEPNAFFFSLFDKSFKLKKQLKKVKKIHPHLIKHLNYIFKNVVAWNEQYNLSDEFEKKYERTLFEPNNREVKKGNFLKINNCKNLKRNLQKNLKKILTLYINTTKQ